MWSAADLTTEFTPLEANDKESCLHNPLLLPPGSFKAYLFDCDGTIVDSMPLHFVAWKKSLGEWNCPFDEELFYAWGGKPIPEIITLLNQMHGLQMPVEEVSLRKEDLYLELLHELKPVPEVVEHVHAMHGKIPFAVVSGSSRKAVIHSLTVLHLIDKFDVIVGAEDYTNSKPAPDAFLQAAAHLGVDPKDCLVFEDTSLGIQAATSAGMASVRVPSPQERGVTGTGAQHTS